MLYIITKKFPDTTAGEDRRRKYLKGLKELHVDYQVVYIGNGIFKTIKTLYSLLFCNRNRSDIFLMFGGFEYQMLITPFLLSRKIFCEITEYPEVYSVIGNKILTKLFFTLYYRSCRKLNGMFVISTALKQFFNERVGLPQDKIHIINILCDKSEFPEEQVNHSNRHGIIYVGSMSNYKDGVDKLQDAYKLLHTDEKLIFVHDKPYNEVIEILCNARLAVLCRPDNIQAKYGFATKLGQYLLSATPVVVTNVGDFTLFLKDGASAIISKPDNIEDFANKMQWALDNYDGALKIGKQGRKVAIENFNYLTETKKIVEIIF
jgi:glycosyltransferase involved in cell wall biosynthesis